MLLVIASLNSLCTSFHTETVVRIVWIRRINPPLRILQPGRVLYLYISVYTHIFIRILYECNAALIIAQDIDQPASGRAVAYN